MLATKSASASMSSLTTALASESMLVAASGSASVLARQYSIRVGVGFSVESVLESLSVLATMSTSASMSLLAIASTSATASTSTSAQKALSDTADLIRDINPLLGFYRTPKLLLARKAPIISIFLMNSCIGVRN
ncbi:MULTISPECIES: hypothetical protein [Paenibacillus]|uniref:Uncharacterized protein n=1 Tax=Paenibacillus odorifer TaxID=189426 RepID=A0A1R0WRI6_9BACL|nr:MULTISPECIES: hypothetical protein [Paenibacillus]MEC0133994.1 hypothetical protein [Paenibacillus odorifer]MEC0222720.1 hypothetical protein [Paenibacillus odorifer]OMD19748.1 hypothetical protein BJP51_10415 [Paenibacillus odorifer]